MEQQLERHESFGTGCLFKIYLGGINSTISGMTIGQFGAGMLRPISSIIQLSPAVYIAKSAVEITKVAIFRKEIRRRLIFLFPTRRCSYGKMAQWPEEPRPEISICRAAIRLQSVPRRLSAIYM